MPDVPFQVERFIVKQLACDEAPAAIAEEVQGTFLRDVSVEDVQAYCPKTDGSALTPDLRDLYQRTRREFVGTATEDPERSFVEVATTGELDDGPLHCVEAGEATLLLVRRGDRIRALQNRCTHQGGPLCEGTLTDEAVECPWHGAQFDPDTGDPANPPATEAVSTYEVRVRGDTIEVKL
jgi:nitrite reductase/ring-hydroxylating ferredoxin subunit